MKAPAALPFYLYDFGAIRPDSFLQGDSFKLLEGVQTETVDMVFIDPPYFIKKAEWDTFENQQEYNDFMARAFWEAERILKPNGTLAFWHNDLQQVKQYDEQIQAADNARFVHNLDANHCNVWLSNEPTGGHSIHPTQKPVDLLERAIRTHTKPGAVVCDFFAGSGSTGVAALKAGRRYILIEQSASYHEKGLAWLEETKSALCT